AVSGVKGENSVKLIGNDIVMLTETADKIKAAMSKVRGVADLAVFTSLGQPTLGIDIDRKAAARYGLAPGDINAAVQTAVGGQAAGDLYEEGSDRHFPLVVRLAPKYRQNIETISSLTIAVQDPATNKVAQIPLSEVASIKPCDRPGVHLPRATAALYSHQIQRSRAGSGQHGARGAAQDCPRSPVARRLSPGMGRRVRQSSGRNQAPQGDCPPDYSADRHIAVHQLRLFDGYPPGHSGHPHGDDRRSLRALAHRNCIQRFSGDWLYCLVWNCRYGRHYFAVLLQPTDRRRRRAQRGNHASMPNTLSAGDDDVHRGVRGIASRRAFNGYRRTGSTPARPGRCRRHPAHSHSGAHHFAGADRRVFETNATGAGRSNSRRARCVGARGILQGSGAGGRTARRGRIELTYRDRAVTPPAQAPPVAALAARRGARTAG